MKLRILSSGRWMITSPIRGENVECPVEKFFNSLGANYESSIDGLVAMMDQHAKYGPGSFNPKQCHYVDQDSKIYQYCKGQLRLFWFEDSGRVIICTHGIIKKSQKTPPREVAKAKRLQKEYFASKAVSGIEIVEED